MKKLQLISFVNAKRGDVRPNSVYMKKFKNIISILLASPQQFSTILRRSWSVSRSLLQRKVNMTDYISLEELPPTTQWEKRQGCVLEILRRAENRERYPLYILSSWYRGAIQTMIAKSSDDYIAQAAHSLREILEKIHLIKLKVNYNKKKTSQRGNIKSGLEVIDPLVHNLGSENLENKVKQWHELRQKFIDISHHDKGTNDKTLKDYIHELEQLIFYFLAPTSAKDQEQIKKILKSTDRSENIVENTFELLEKRGANFVYFLQEIINTEDASWLLIIKEKGCFSNPPEATWFDDGSVITPFWLPMSYLLKMANHKPDMVATIIEELPEVENSYICNTLVDIALCLDIKNSLKIKPKLLNYIKKKHVWY